MNDDKVTPPSVKALVSGVLLLVSVTYGVRQLMQASYYQDTAAITRGGARYFFGLFVDRSVLRAARHYDLQAETAVLLGVVSLVVALGALVYLVWCLATRESPNTPASRTA